METKTRRTETRRKLESVASGCSEVCLFIDRQCLCGGGRQRLDGTSGGVLVEQGRVCVDGLGSDGQCVLEAAGVCGGCVRGMCAGGMSAGGLCGRLGAVRQDVGEEVFW